MLDLEWMCMILRDFNYIKIGKTNTIKQYLKKIL